jgi:hypothetical protein
MNQQQLIASIGVVVLFGIVVWVKMWIRGGGVTRMLAKRK